MITKNISWSLGPTPNKSLESVEPSIPIRPPGDLQFRGQAAVPYLGPVRRALTKILDSGFVFIRVHSWFYPSYDVTPCNNQL
jgi:hypothetical protein